MAPTSEDVKADVLGFLRSNLMLDDSKNKLGDSDSFLERGIIDSTGILEVIGFLQTQYCLEVKDDEMLPENLDSLDNISAFVLRKTATK